MSRPQAGKFHQENFWQMRQPLPHAQDYSPYLFSAVRFGDDIKTRTTHHKANPSVHWQHLGNSEHYAQARQAVTLPWWQSPHRHFRW